MRFLLLFTLLLPLAAWSQDRSLQITNMRQLDTVLQPADYQVLIIHTDDPVTNRVHYTARLNQFVNVHTVYYMGQKVVIEADTDVRYIPGTAFYPQSHEERDMFVDQSAINKLTWLKVSENIRLRSNGYRTKPISLQINRVTYENPYQPVHIDSLFWGNGHFYRFEIFEGAESVFTRPLTDITLAPGQHYIPIPGINYNQFRSYETLLHHRHQLNSKTAFQVINQSLKGSTFDIHELYLGEENLHIGFIERTPALVRLMGGHSDGFNPELIDTFRPNLVITYMRASKELWQFMTAPQNNKIIADIQDHIPKKVLRRMGRTSNSYYLVLSDIPWRNNKLKSDAEVAAYAQKLQEKYRSFLRKKRITNIYIEVIVGT